MKQYLKLLFITCTHMNAWEREDMIKAIEAEYQRKRAHIITQTIIIVTGIIGILTWLIDSLIKK